MGEIEAVWDGEVTKLHDPLHSFNHDAEEGKECVVKYRLSLYKKR